MDEIEQMISEGGPGTGNVADDGNQQQNTPPAPDYKAMFEQSQAQMKALMEQSTAILQQAQAPRTNIPAPIQPDLFSGFEPETANALKKVVDSLKGQFTQELAKRDAELVKMRTNNEFAEVIAASPNVATPAIVKRAKELHAGLSANGVPVNANDLFNFAIGEAVRNGTYNPNQRVTAPPVLNGGSTMPTYKRPVNFDNLPLSQQFSVMEKNGELDEPF